jgi:hypothetical protein
MPNAKKRLAGDIKRNSLRAKARTEVEEGEHYLQKLKARRGVEAYEKAKKAGTKKKQGAAMKQKKKRKDSPVEFVKGPKGKWTTQLKAKVRRALKAQKNKSTRTSQVAKAVGTGLTKKELDKMR